MWEEEEHISDIPAFQSYLQTIERFYAECGKPIGERTFSERQKKDFIGFFESDNRLNHATELELQLCRQFTEELLEKGSKTALHLKGYACYGGNRLYDCDWPTSRDCVLQLYEKTDNPQYANTLGYIYYYGRCTDGVPEYEKAFEMFGVSAANGLYEGMYKLADMFLHGYACKQSAKTAKRLYELVYNDSLKNFVLGQDNSFADAAIRMGNIYLKGIDAQIDPATAYSYYLQADFAHRRRIENSDFFGNTTVAINIRKSLDETKALLEKDYFREYTKSKQPWLIYSLLEGNNRITLSVEKTDDNSALIRASRVPIKTGKYVSPILITEPRLDWCELSTEVTLEAINIRTAFNSEENGLSLIDYAEWNWEEQRVDFFNADHLIGWITCDEYRHYGPKKPSPSGKLIRLVTVRFQPNGRSYDYLCEDESVQKGDTVIVPGYSGETATEVIKIYTQYESELGLPLERYKKVIRKGEMKSPQKNDLPGYYTEVPDTWTKKEEILERFAQHQIEVHTKAEPEYDYLECDEAVVLIIKNPYWDQDLEIELDAEFTLFFGGYHTHYFTYEYDYQQMLQTAQNIMDNKLCASVTFAGENWCGSMLSGRALTLEEYYAEGRENLRALGPEVTKATEIRNIFWKPTAL